MVRARGVEEGVDYFLRHTDLCRHMGPCWHTDPLLRRDQNVEHIDQNVGRRGHCNVSPVGGVVLEPEEGHHGYRTELID